MTFLLAAARELAAANLYTAKPLGTDQRRAGPFTVGDSATRRKKGLIQNQPLLLSSQLRHADRFYGDTEIMCAFHRRSDPPRDSYGRRASCKKSSQCSCNSGARSNSERGGPPYIPTTTLNEN